MVSITMLGLVCVRRQKEKDYGNVSLRYQIVVFIIWYVEFRNIFIKAMFNFRFGQKEVAPKNFYKQRQITDIFMINVSKVVLSNKVSCNNGKDCRYIVGYQLDHIITPLFIKTPKNIFSYNVSQCDKNSAYIMSFNVSEALECVLQYRKIWNEVGLQ